jgi:hypothetical protein
MIDRIQESIEVELDGFLLRNCRLPLFKHHTRDIIESIPRWETRAQLNAFPPGLDSLYQRMMDHIYHSNSADLYKQILASTAVVYRPVTLKELTSLVEMLEGMADDLESLSEIIGHCRSFLTVREGIVYFVHQSAKIIY